VFSLQLRFKVRIITSRACHVLFMQNPSDPYKALLFLPC
jgi:hypothetical protein